MIRKNSGYRPSENLNISARVLGFERNDGSQVLYNLFLLSRRQELSHSLSLFLPVLPFLLFFVKNVTFYYYKNSLPQVLSFGRELLISFLFHFIPVFRRSTRKVPTISFPSFPYPLPLSLIFPVFTTNFRCPLWAFFVEKIFLI